MSNRYWFWGCTAWRSAADLSVFTCVCMYMCTFEYLIARWALQELTCMPDALILGSFPVASPWCLQNQCWNAQSHRGRREERCIHTWTFWLTLFYSLHLCYWPMSGFFAWSASSVLKSVFGTRMKIFVLWKPAKRTFRPHCFKHK